MRAPTTFAPRNARRYSFDVVRRSLALGVGVGLVACGTLLESGVPVDPGVDGDADAPFVEPTADATTDVAEDVIPPCDPGDADLTSSRFHCGRCGRACEVGECEAGMCAARPFTTGGPLHEPIAFVQVGNDLFIGDYELSGGAGGIAKCSGIPAPGGPECLVQFLGIRPELTGLLVPGGTVLFSSQSRFAGAPSDPPDLDGGIGSFPVDKTPVAPDASPAPFFMAADARAIAIFGGDLMIADPRGLYTCTPPPVGINCGSPARIGNTKTVLDVSADTIGYCMAGSIEEPGLYCGGTTSVPPVLVKAGAAKRVKLLGPNVLFQMGGSWSISGRSLGSVEKALSGMATMDDVVVVGDDVYGVNRNASHASVFTCKRQSCDAPVEIGRAPWPAPLKTAIAVIGDFVYYGTKEIVGPGNVKYRWVRVPR